MLCIALDRARNGTPSPRGERRRRCSPNPTLLPCPAGQPPLKLIGAARAPGAADVISPSEGVHAVSAQHCGFGRGVASGPQVSVALPALRPVAPPEALRLLWRIVLRGSGPKAPLNQRCGGVAVPQAGTVSTGGGHRFHWPIDRNSTVSPRVNQPEHGGAGGPQSSEATRPIAREACHPSLAFYTDTFDRDFTLFFWAMVDGLENDLALSTNASALWR
jgi:hypothetical protein